MPRGRPVGSTTKKKPVQKLVKDKKFCMQCSTEKTTNLFYKSNNPQHKYGVFDACKDCIKPKNPHDLNEVSKMLRFLDRPFINEIWNKSLVETKGKGWKDEGIFGGYLKNLQMQRSKYEFATWNDSEDINASTKTTVQGTKVESEVHVLSDEYKTFKEDCIRLLNHDPFDGYGFEDQKFMYAELITYLDEDTLEDQFKISVIIQIINNNNQIRKVDLNINKLSSNSESLRSNISDIQKMTDTKKKLSENNDKLSKENSIAIKHRGDKRVGKSTLGYLMKDLRELGFDKAEENYYDMKKTYGMQVTADISNKSIISQLNFDEKDIQDMFKEQRDLIIELQNKNEELEEKLRLVKLDLKNAVTK